MNNFSKSVFSLINLGIKKSHLDYQPRLFVKFYYWFRELWNFKWTSHGKLFLLSLPILGYIGLITPLIPIYHIFSVFVAVYFVIYVNFKLSKKKNIKFDFQFPEKGCAGEILSLDFQVTNLSDTDLKDFSVSIFDLPVEFEYVKYPEILSDFQVNEKEKFSLQLKPLKRGIYEFPELRAYTCFPFGICRKKRDTAKTGTIKIYPHYFQIYNINLPVGRMYQPGGIALTSSQGESPEYIGNREYRDGDPLKRIDFKSWARIGKPAVREYQEEFYCRIGLVLDTFISPEKKWQPEGFPELESAISLSASVADSLSRGEYIIDIFAAGPELYVFRAGRNLAFLENILDILACIEETRENPFDKITPVISEELKNISSVICVMLDWDEKRENFVKTVFESGSSARVIIVRDGETTLSYENAKTWAGHISHFKSEDIKQGKIELI